MAQFVVNSTSVENIISSIKEGEIAIPEIQRPFVWDFQYGICDREHKDQCRDKEASHERGCRELLLGNHRGQADTTLRADDRWLQRLPVSG